MTELLEILLTVLSEPCINYLWISHKETASEETI